MASINIQQVYNIRSKILRCQPNKLSSISSNRGNTTQLIEIVRYPLTDIIKAFHDQVENSWLAECAKQNLDGEREDEFIAGNINGGTSGKVKAYITNLNEQQLLILATYLCYPSNGFDETGLAYLLSNQFSDSPQAKQLNRRKMKIIIELCNQLASRLLDYNIDKINSFRSDQNGLEKSFISALNQAKQAAKDRLRTSFPDESVRYTLRSIKRIINNTPAVNWRGGALKQEIADEILHDLRNIEKYFKYIHLKNQTSEAEIIAATVSAYVNWIKQHLSDGEESRKRIKEQVQIAIDKNSERIRRGEITDEKIKKYIEHKGKNTTNKNIERIRRGEITNEEIKEYIEHKGKNTINKNIEHIGNIFFLEHLEQSQAEMEEDTRNEVRLFFIKKELNRVTKQVDNYRKIVKGGGTLDPNGNPAKGAIIPIAFSGLLPATVLYNGLSESPVISDSVTNSALESSLLNVALEALTGVFMAVARKEQVDIDRLVKQSINLYKKYLLHLIHEYYKLGGELSKAEEEKYRKFLAIKRGNRFRNLIPPTLLFNQTTSTRQFDKLLSGKDIDHDTHTRVIQDLQDEFVSFANLKADFKTLVKTERYDQLEALLSELREKEKALNKITNITFKSFKIKDFKTGLLRVGNLRGNLLAHLTEANCSDPENPHIQNCLKTVIDLTETNSKIFRLAKRSNYINLRLHFFENYEVTNKFDFLIDWQNAVLGIELNPHLLPSHKQELKADLVRELAKIDGKFSAIHAKRNNLIPEAVLGAVTVQGLTTKGYVNTAYQAISHSEHIPSSVIASSAFAGWAIFSLLSPLRDLFLQGSTTTSNSALKMLRFTEQARYIQDQFETAQSEAAKAKTAATESNEDRAPTNLSLGHADHIQKFFTGERTLANIKAEMLSYISEAKCLENLELDKLIESNRADMGNEKFLLWYLILNEEYKGNTLFYHLINRIEALHKKKLAKARNEEQIEEYSNYFNELMNSVMKFWGEVVTKVMQPEAQQSPDNYISTVPEEWSQRDLEKYTDLVSNCATANDALRHLYKSLGLIYLDQDEGRRVAKLNYLIGLIERAHFHNNSRWATLRRHSTRRILIIKCAIRAVAAGLYGATAALLMAHPHVGAAIAIPVLLAVAGLRMLLYALADNLSFGNTRQYKQAKLLCTHARRVNASNQQHQIQTHPHKLHPSIIKVTDAEETTVEFKKVMNDFPLNDTLVKEYINRFNNAGNDTNSLLNTVYDMIKACSKLSDKYLAEESVLRMVAIVYHSDKLAAQDQLSIILLLATLFEKRTLQLAAFLAEEQSYARKRNYFVVDIVGGMLFSTAPIVGWPDFLLPKFLQLVCSTAADTLAVLGLTYATESSGFGNTTSYQKTMEFLQCASCYFHDSPTVRSEENSELDSIYDELIQADFTRNQIKTMAKIYKKIFAGTGRNEPQQI